MTDNGLGAGDEQPVNRAAVCVTSFALRQEYFQVTKLWTVCKAKRGNSRHLC